MANKRRKGNQFEKQTLAYVESILDMQTNIIYYSMESRASRGYADLMIVAYNIKQNRHYPFGIQCKFGYLSPKTVKQGVRDCFKKYGLTLFYASGSFNDIEIRPDIEDYIALIGR